MLRAPHRTRQDDRCRRTRPLPLDAAPDRSSLGWLLLIPIGCLALGQAILALTGTRAGPRRLARRFRRLHAPRQAAAAARRRRLVRSPRAADQSARRPRPALDPRAGCAAARRGMAAAAVPGLRAGAARLGRPDQPGPARARDGRDRLGRSPGARSRHPPVRLPGPAHPAERARLYQRRPARPSQPAAAAGADPDRAHRASGRGAAGSARGAARRRDRRARHLGQPRGDDVRRRQPRHFGTVLAGRHAGHGPDQSRLSSGRRRRSSPSRS